MISIVLCEIPKLELSSCLNAYSECQTRRIPEFQMVQCSTLASWFFCIPAIYIFIYINKCRKHRTTSIEFCFIFAEQEKLLYFVLYALCSTDFPCRLFDFDLKCILLNFSLFVFCTRAVAFWGGHGWLAVESHYASLYFNLSYSVLNQVHLNIKCVLNHWMQAQTMRLKNHCFGMNEFAGWMADCWWTKSQFFEQQQKRDQKKCAII